MRIPAKLLAGRLGEGSPGIAGVIHYHCLLGGSRCSSGDAHQGAQGSEDAEKPPWESWALTEAGTATLGPRPVHPGTSIPTEWQKPPRGEALPP